MAITSAVQGPTPGIASNCRRTFPVAPGIQDNAAVGNPGNKCGKCPSACLGYGQIGGIDLGELLDRRERVGQRALGVVDRPPMGSDESARVGSHGLGRHLLAQHRPHRQFRLVDGAGNTLSGGFGHHRAQVWVRLEYRNHRFRVCVEVQEPTATGNRGREVAEVVEHEQAADMIGSRRQGDQAIAGREPQCASVPTIAHLLATRHCAGGQMTETPL